MVSAMVAVVILGLAGTSGAVDDPPKSITELVEDLRGDDTEWNCHAALGELRELGLKARPELERALESTDLQQRQAAALLLSAVEGYEPTENLLEVLVEGLANDQFPYERLFHQEGTYTYIFNASCGVRYLAEHAVKAESRLIKALESRDLQQRFLAAVALGFGGRSNAAIRAASILIPHLRDNRIPCDAVLAAGALYRFGPAVSPALVKALDAPVDRQQAEVLRLILRDLNQPPVTAEDFRARRGSQRICAGWADPVVSLRLDQVSLDWGSRMTEKNRDTAPAATVVGK